MENSSRNQAPHRINRAVAFGRRHQSALTKLVHLYQGEAHSETIPIYENFCFALSLIRQKTIDQVTEGKQLFERLFCFQAPASTIWSGNFPLYLHDFPKCYSALQPLKIALILQILLKQFSSILNEEFKTKARLVLSNLMECAKNIREDKAFNPIWERRYQALIGNALPIVGGVTSLDWCEELITSHLINQNLNDFFRVIHPSMGMYVGPSSHETQYQSQPNLTLLDYWMTSPMAQHSSAQLELALLEPPSNDSFPLWSGTLNGWQIVQKENEALIYAAFSPKGDDRLALRYIWRGERQFHSLVVPTGKSSVQIKESQEQTVLLFDLEERDEIIDNNLFELNLFCNISDETKISVDQKIATLFSLSQEVVIETFIKKLRLKFQIVDGQGEFCGHICQSNRPFQTQSKNGESYDWQIAIRTLRRSKTLRLSLTLIDSVV